MKKIIKKIISPRNLGTAVAILVIGGLTAYAAVPAYKGWLQQGANLYTTGTNVGIGTTNPGANLEVVGDFIRTIARSHGYNQVDETDNGPIATRVLTFTKKKDDTGIRVTHTDGRRCLGNNVACRWEIRFNGTSCSNPGPLAYDIYVWNSGGYIQDIHRNYATVGTCFGLTAGTYTIQVYVGPILPGPIANAYTGWIGYWSLEAEEVR